MLIFNEYILILENLDCINTFSQKRLGWKTCSWSPILFSWYLSAFRSFSRHQVESYIKFEYDNPYSNIRYLIIVLGCKNMYFWKSFMSQGRMLRGSKLFDLITMDTNELNLSAKTSLVSIPSLTLNYSIYFVNTV